jgi:hypothetical protein
MALVDLFADPLDWAPRSAGNDNPIRRSGPEPHRISIAYASQGQVLQSIASTRLADKADHTITRAAVVFFTNPARFFITGA